MTVLTSTAAPASAQDREALAASVRDLIRRRGDSASVRAAMAGDGRTDAALWSTLCTEIGVAALAIPESYDGAGASFAETAAVLEELGAALSPVPALGSAVLATAAILIADDPDSSARLLPGMAAGERTAALCWAGAGGWDTTDVRADAGLLSGTAHFVIDGEVADTLLVIASGGEAITLHEVDADADGITVTPLPTMDPTRPLSSVTFDDVASVVIPAPADLTARLRALGWALLASEQVGGAQAALDLTVDYTGSRKQFGRTIGSFQALKHRMADMYVLVETARSIARAAVDAVVTGAPDAADLARAAHVYCSEAYTSVTGEAIQLHGGIGITWEHDIQLYFKRAHGSAQLLGAPSRAVAEIAAELRA
ncbi:acyl-CoA dehydrogenase family protein [Gordonia sp. ABSL1-1]|uniref:acyl-CoA dehydrogenase family protein n=1 Tax=Gordonia sp. ABSL1-1 TaxID=3053923 RepID=UPI002572B5C0|nr:acyl-CoA dehydrogenase family protein [Gordonia sp. ABSL1-1]MDL9936189.1 acyl-CoA dehydrogenase family protein [Gordonia sp. ABSL1-1]